MLRLFFCLALLAPSSIAVPAPDVRAPTGKWVVDFADAQCFAVRDYGTPDNPIQLLLKAPAIGGVVQIAIARREPSALAAQMKGMVTVDDQPPFKASTLAYTPKDSQLRVYTTNLSSAQFALVRQGNELSIRAGELDERYSLSRMTELMKVVDDCVADVRRLFNITDPESGDQSPLKRRAKANLGRIFHDSDYPRIALERDQSGRVTFGLLIDEKGRVADCTIVATSGVATLDAQACAILTTRAQFKPAIGPDGKPARDAVTATIVWRMAY
jgi:TonB family protein